jgi:transmembrane sensor
MIQEVLNLNRLRAMAPDEAAALLTVRRSDGGGGRDQNVLLAWLDLDRAHLPAWDGAQRAWRAFEDVEGDEILNAMRRDALRARPVAPPPRAWLAAAAVLVLLSGGLFTVFGDAGLARRPTAPAVAAQSVAASVGPKAAAIYATLRGQQQVFSLPDGSHMTLDTDSEVDLAFAPERRDLRLVKGRAFFDVAHDARRPFVVAANGREVSALGTRFDVRLDPGQVRVVLVEGRVSVKSAHRSSPPTVLKAGEQLVDRAGDAPVVSIANVEETLNWRDGFITFNDDTLSTAAAELNRYSNDQLVVRDPRIARMRISGMFRAGDVARFGRTLAQIHPVRIVRTGADHLEIVAAN